MAHTQGTTGRVQRLTSLVAMLAVAAAIALAFGRVFVEGGVTRTLLIAGVATALVAWVLERRSLLLTTMAEIVLLLVLLGVLVFRDTTWYLLPGIETLRAIGEAAGQVGEQARLQVAPAPPVIPLVFATVAAVWAAVFSCHALAFRAGSPLLALIPPAALIVFADSVLDDSVRPIYGLWLLVAALAVLFADSLRRMQGWGPVWGGPGRSDRLVPGAGRNARTVAACAVGVALVAPFVVPGFGGRAVIDVTDLGGGDGVNLSPLVSMASRLHDGEPKDLFEVETERPSYWRLTALERFDGVEWLPAEGPTSPIEPGIPIPGVVVDEGETSTQTFTFLQDFEFSVEEDVDAAWLPTTYRPTTIDLDASWDPATATILRDAQIREGDGYTVTSTYVAPNPEEIEQVDVDLAVGAELVSLPPDAPPEIEEQALSLTEGLDSDYERVMAIQKWLTTTGGFVYEPDVAFRADIDTLYDFMFVSKRGFCQQYATAMAVLLRSIGIPARLGVGFTEGVRAASGGDRWLVTTRDYHAWVEVPFEEGYGWLTFEPTPGRDDPISSVYNQPESTTPCRGLGCGPDGDEDPPPSPNPSLSRIPIDGEVPDDVVRVSAVERWTRTGGPWAAGVAVAVASVWLLVRWRRRRRAYELAHRAPREAIVTAYGTFIRRAGAAGASRLPGETPEDLRARLALMLEDPEPLDRLTRLTIQAAYAPREPSSEDALDAQADADVAARELRRVTRRGRRRKTPSPA